MKYCIKIQPYCSVVVCNKQLKGKKKKKINNNQQKPKNKKWMECNLNNQFESKDEKMLEKMAIDSNIDKLENATFTPLITSKQGTEHD